MCSTIVPHFPSPQPRTLFYFLALSYLYIFETISLLLGTAGPSHLDRFVHSFTQAFTSFIQDGLDVHLLCAGPIIPRGLGP
jgi:hypothetical protein